MKQLIYYSEEMSTIFSIFPVFFSSAWDKGLAFVSFTRTFQIKYTLEEMKQNLFVIGCLVVIIEHVAVSKKAIPLYCRVL